MLGSAAGLSALVRAAMHLRHSSSTASPLSQSTVDHFKTHGWVAVQSFWNQDELQALRTALSQLQQSGQLANVATDGDGCTHTEIEMNLQLCPLSPEAPIFRSLPFHPRVASSVSQLLVDDPATENVLCYLSQVFWKPPLHGVGTGWHQDNAYFRVADGSKGTAMWTAIHDATVENGTIEMDGDSRVGVLGHVRDLSSDHHITCSESVADEKAIPVELAAGGVVFFNFDKPHCTRANTTPHSRAGIAYHFLNCSHVPTERAFPLPNSADWRAPIVSGPKCTNGVAEYGEVANTWERDLQALL